MHHVIIQESGSVSGCESAYGFKGVVARKSTSHGNRDREVIKEMHLLHDLGFLLRCERIIAASS